MARKAQDPRVWPALAAALREVWRELDTDLSLEEVLDYLPYARDFQVALATLPTREGAGTYLYVDEARRGSFLPPFSGGRPSPAPGLPVRLRGDAGLIAWGRAFLEREGVEVRTEEAEVARSAVYASDPAVGRYYAGLFHLPVIAPHRPLAEVVVELGPDLLH